MKVFPVRSAGPTFPNPRRTGQFQGTIPQQTPIGGKVCTILRSSFSSSSSSLTSIFANVLSHSRDRVSSVLARPIGFPCSLTSNFSSSPWLASMASAKSKSRFALSLKLVLDHVLNATLAYSTASSTSACVATGTSYKASAVDGLMEWRVFVVAIILLLIILPANV